MAEVFISVGVFTGIVLSLVAVILVAKSRLVASGTVNIVVNEQRRLSVPVGGKLLSVLADNGIFVPSACGGGGTCGHCTVKLLSGGRAFCRPNVATSRRGWPARATGCLARSPSRRTWTSKCPPRSSRRRSGRARFARITTWPRSSKNWCSNCPRGRRSTSSRAATSSSKHRRTSSPTQNFDIEEMYRADWDKFNIWRYESVVAEPVYRAYSMANYPGETGIVMLNVRIATPPPARRKARRREKSRRTSSTSSRAIRSRSPGRSASSSSRRRTPKWCISAAARAWLRCAATSSSCSSSVTPKRKVSFWYGGRSLRELFYVEEFRELEAEHPNFSFHVALSEPLPEDNWTGDTGFIHQVLHDNYLAEHPAPEDIEYYICGPPLMLQACQKLLDDLGVEADNIAFDDFGE